MFLSRIGTPDSSNMEANIRSVHETVGEMKNSTHNSHLSKTCVWSLKSWIQLSGPILVSPQITVCCKNCTQEYYKSYLTRRNFTFKKTVVGKKNRLHIKYAEYMKCDKWLGYILCVLFWEDFSTFLYNDSLHFNVTILNVSHQCDIRH